MKDHLGRKIMTEFVALTPKTYSHLMDDGNSCKKFNRAKMCVIKRILKFNDCKNCLLNKEIILKSLRRSKSEAHHVYIEEINKIALSKMDEIVSHSYVTNAGKKCKTELLEHLNMK